MSRRRQAGRHKSWQQYTGSHYLYFSQLAQPTARTEMVVAVCHVPCVVCRVVWLLDWRYAMRAAKGAILIVCAALEISRLEWTPL